MKKVLVSLISDQTIPNVLFIKEFFNKVNKFLFITTDEMESKAVLPNIIKVCNINENKYEKIIIPEYEIDKIKELLNLTCNSLDEFYIVNLTGGTKIMSIGVYEFFKERKSEIFYLPIGKNEYKKIFPFPVENNSLKTRLNVEDYMLSYGIEIKKYAKTTTKDYESNKRFLNEIFFNYNREIKFLVEFQNRKEIKNLSEINLDKHKAELTDNLNNLDNLIKQLNFNYQNLKKSELKYITGGWFEEYIYQTIKESGNIKDETILLNPVISRNNIQNEFDIAICYENRLDIIECKTSLKYQDKNLLNDTIYKQSALRKEFGLTVNTIIVTLDEINDENRKRADYMKIKILDKNYVLDENKLKEAILNIIGIK
ncbi:MAG: Card1-like endonuclease domain-containing protein [Brevinematia bacterium]